MQSTFTCYTWINLSSTNSEFYTMWKVSVVPLEWPCQTSYLKRTKHPFYSKSACTIQGMYMPPPWGPFVTPVGTSLTLCEVLCAEILQRHRFMNILMGWCSNQRVDIEQDGFAYDKRLMWFHNRSQEVYWLCVNPESNVIEEINVVCVTFSGVEDVYSCVNTWGAYKICSNNLFLPVSRSKCKLKTELQDSNGTK